ncbi:MAG: hypothetical protein IJQ77_04935, partial [Synergistaceae bacterium]|nr:hypothetical protein [Synergistaceae bacterium]
DSYIDILPIAKARGFWYHQTPHSEECLTGSTPMVDAPTIYLFFSSIFMINASIFAQLPPFLPDARSLCF